MKILLIRFSSIGDIILTTPLIRSLKIKYPDAIIDYLTHEEYKPLLENNPGINAIYCHKRYFGLYNTIKYALFLKKNTEYDYIFDLHKSLRSRVYCLFPRAKQKKAFGKNYLNRFLLVKFKINLNKKISTVTERYFDTAKGLDPVFCNIPEIWASNDKIYEAVKKINEISGTKLQCIKKEKKIIRIEKGIIKNNENKIAFMPFAKWFSKEWGDEKFIALGKMITESSGSAIMILGGKNDAERAANIAKGIGSKTVMCAGKLDIIQTAVLLSISAALVTNDTGIMHIGNAVSIPVAAIFGSTTEELGFFPNGTDTQVIQTKLACRPCTTKGLPRCPKGHFKCMNDIQAEAVYDSIRKYL